MAPDRGRHNNIEIEGVLEAYKASPKDAILWSIHEDGRPGPEGVHPLLNGDLLIVHAVNGATAWEGIINLDFESCRDADSTKLQQTALGHSIHGVQKGEDPEVWTRMFFEARRATLKR